MSSLTQEIAHAAAQLVVEQGMEYSAAKRKAAQQLGRSASRSGELPDNAAVEEAVREYIALFCPEEQAYELAALRELAAQWMRRLAAFNPHLGGAVWRGTATRHSAILLDLYCEDSKMAEIELINMGLRFESGERPGAKGAQAIPLIMLELPCAALGDSVVMELSLLDHNDLRGALKPDAQGRSWRGNLQALEALIAASQHPDARP